MLSTLSFDDEQSEMRYQDLVAKFLFAQAKYNASQKECTHLQMVLGVKQALIEKLLPYYPHQITRSMQAQIYLT